MPCLAARLSSPAPDVSVPTLVALLVLEFKARMRMQQLVALQAKALGKPGGSRMKVIESGEHDPTFRWHGPSQRMPKPRRRFVESDDRRGKGAKALQRLLRCQVSGHASHRQPGAEALQALESDRRNIHHRDRMTPPRQWDRVTAVAAREVQNLASGREAPRPVLDERVRLAWALFTSTILLIPTVFIVQGQLPAFSDTSGGTPVQCFLMKSSRPEPRR